MMKKVFMLLALTASYAFGSVALAQNSNPEIKTFIFQAYGDDDYSETYPFEITIQATNDYLTITRLIVKETENNITFFDLTGDQLKSSQDALLLKIEDTVQNLKPLNKKPYSNSYGDTDISRKDTYAIYLDLYFDEATGTFTTGRIEISNNEAGEMALWGDLKLN